MQPGGISDFKYLMKYLSTNLLNTFSGADTRDSAASSTWDPRLHIAWNFLLKVWCVGQ